MILRAAEELFFERSFAAVGVDEIGERAGVTGPAIYRHFSGKDEILATLFDDAIDALVELTPGSHEDPWQELEALVRGHAAFVFENRKLAGVKIREERSLAEPYRKRLHRREARYLGRWRDCLKRCFPDQPGDVLAMAVAAAVGALNSIATWPPEALKTDGAADILSEVVLHGLGSFAHAPGERLDRVA
jgi:AcrR family transcriptional regulator